MVRGRYVPEIVKPTLVGGEAVERLLYIDPKPAERRRGKEEITFYQRQSRTVKCANRAGADDRDPGICR